ncbi:MULTISPECIES: CDP-alcohol phosphatidyltransferase family protein [unclassified Solwaraspora]|uniref:CDP-alcohol phosphatidyltransferase family protein n=1 Tax=unclassified Solwaraspora TaxID=2627926 RepID=UPI00248AB0D7|nr:MULTISPECIES: CDP-alcohol phosphatidyltransferase family protein [unclassified Solwaraspora]WBB97706.1 CDP-alcohol phosphatidyltransferase family protein [Solwaraspora sp. WMMA2059]WBC18403.1 CDP-alcohol phosphatidyltransferase family protein [Solwaraspora sp. WMMA2080]WJK34182.1 CDP-alcohol phosphatidyltransferase family protein [Solwaraspora sp. WMMA2065]
MDGPAGPVRNVPNLITTVRTVVAVGLAVLAVVGDSTVLTGVAIGCYWIGDMADGLAARLLRQETRFGAVYDIVCDRVCCLAVAAALIPLLPSMGVPLVIFVVQFVVVDLVLSLSFLRWPLLSPNYFHLVHTQVYRFNWSPVAKALNTGGLVLLVVLAPSPVLPVAFTLAIAAVKLASLVVVARIPLAVDLPGLRAASS